MKGKELISKFKGIEEVNKKVYLSVLDEAGLQYSTAAGINEETAEIFEELPGTLPMRWTDFVLKINGERDYPGYQVIVSADSIHLVLSAAIVINNSLESESCMLFDSSHSEVGEITNELALLDIMKQLRRNRESGYYIIWKGNTIGISSSGQLDYWPENFFGSLRERLLDELIYDIL